MNSTAKLFLSAILRPPARDDPRGTLGPGPAAREALAVRAAAGADFSRDHASLRCTIR
jgi:hypothetical protein